MSVLAKAEAKKIIDYYNITIPEEINLEIISAGLNVIIEEKEIDGSEGRITHNGKSGIIVVNSLINYLPKKRFTIAHELGHFQLHKNIRLYGCESDKFFHFNSGQNPESDANIFAAELLMPENMFLKFVRGKMISLKLISDISDYFSTSLQAASFRYAEIGPHPTAMIFCKDGVVKWSKINKDFTHQFIRNGMEVSQNSYTSDFFIGKPVPQTPEEIPSEAWFIESFHYKPDTFVFEQCFQFPEINCILAVIWEK